MAQASKYAEPGLGSIQCPLCTKQVGQFVGSTEKFQAAKAKVVFVYPGPADQLKRHAEQFVTGKNFPDSFRLLIDPNYSFTNAYHLRWDAPGETAYPSTFVIGKDRKVLFSKVSKTHGGRSTFDEVLKALEN